MDLGILDLLALLDVLEVLDLPVPEVVRILRRGGGRLSISGLVFRVWYFVFRDSGFEFRVLWFGNLVFGLIVYCLVLRV